MSGRILAGFLAVLLMMVAGAAEPTRVVQAEEILQKIELGQPVEYDNVTVVGDLNLIGLELPRVRDEKNIGLPDYEFLVSSPISISNSVIKGSVYTNGVIFQNAVVFQGTIFREPAFLMGSRFNQIAYFSGAQFNQTAYFIVAQFNQTADFWMAQFNQTANFREAQFNQESHFEDAGFFNAFFNNSQFIKEAFFEGAQINGTLSLYRTKYDILNIRWDSIRGELAYDDTAYHLLIQNFNKLGFGDDASECQYSYRYKHMQERWRNIWEPGRNGEIDRWFFDFLAWLTYGFGLRPVRPLGWALLFILIGGIFFTATNSITCSKENAGKTEKRPDPNQHKEDDQESCARKISIWEALLLSATYFTSGASSIISATPTEFVPIGRGRYVVVILRLLGWIFFVLFLSSLTRTV